MSFSSTAYIDRLTGVTTRFLFGTWGAGVPQSYPEFPDSLWRFFSAVTLSYNKVAAATATMQIQLDKDGFANPFVFWERFMEIAELTTSPADLQGTETVGSDNDYRVPWAGISGNGILMPPRSRLQMVSANAVLNMSAVIQEAKELNQFRGFI